MLVKGTVYKSTGSWYSFKGEDGVFYNCRIKGKFRTKGIKATNPVAVGDFITTTGQSEEDLTITEIEPRKNYIIRKSTNLSKQHHIISANIDQVVMIATVDFPYTSLEFIDRVSITAEAYDVPFVLILNKADLFEGEHRNQLEFYKNIYESIGIQVYISSSKNSEAISDLIQVFKNKKSLVTGHSGVGKSTLVNTIDPKLNLKTSAVSDHWKTGKHTTTFAEMFDLSFGGQIIDTPGLRAFGLIEFEKENLSHYFKEMQPYLNKCKFHNCTHLHEPGCELIQAVKADLIPPSRYKTYCNIMLDDNSVHRENIHQ